MRKVVVLPQPEAPRRAKKEPAGIVSVRSSTAATSPNFFVRFTRWRSSTRSVPLMSPTTVPPDAIGCGPHGQLPIAFWKARW
ncbi:unannotated protein [freshwater metagenome]|uniref:Unannotated protein n=1 Tax=freshwater metagenome TaxID=449393 RepID=A0A6J7PIY7_9ZZZZ